MKRFGNYYIISIKQNNDIEKMIRIIDYGKVGSSPLHIFDKSFSICVFIIS